MRCVRRVCVASDYVVDTVKAQTLPTDRKQPWASGRSLPGSACTPTRPLGSAHFPLCTAHTPTGPGQASRLSPRLRCRPDTPPTAERGCLLTASAECAARELGTCMHTLIAAKRKTTKQRTRTVLERALDLSQYFCPLGRCIQRQEQPRIRHTMLQQPAVTGLAVRRCGGDTLWGIFIPLTSPRNASWRQQGQSEGYPAACETA